VPTPKERVRELMETATGHQWSIKREDAAALEYVSTTKTTPGLCIFANNNATLSPETRLLEFNKNVGDFSFDDPPESVAVFDGTNLDKDALRKGVRLFLADWLKVDGWGSPEETPLTNKTCVNWIFRHNDERPPPLALGAIRFDNMPLSAQINIERFHGGLEEKTGAKFRLCISLVDCS
jgi:hypothetical protein